MSNVIFANASVLNTEEANDKYFAACDARARSAANIGKYTNEQVAFSNMVYAMACNVFKRSTVYKNYREKFIAVKVNNVQRADLATLAVADFEAFCNEHGIKAKKTRSNALILELN